MGQIREPRKPTNRYVRALKLVRKDSRLSLASGELLRVMARYNMTRLEFQDICYMIGEQRRWRDYAGAQFADLSEKPRPKWKRFRRRRGQ
jgi:hypothetical protein